MSIFYFIYLHALFLNFFFILPMVNRLYTMVNNLFTIMNQFYVIVSKLYTIINKLFTKKIVFLLKFQKWI